MNKTNTGLVEYAKAQLGLPYWYGTFGHVGTEALYLYNKKRLPDYYTATDFPSQYGKRVHDCIGLIKGYLWSDTPTSEPKYLNSPCKTDHSADSMLAACKESGKISTIPEIPGILVFMSQHIGVYIGNGQVIEARGHKYGVVQTNLKGRGWKNWGKCPYITYETEEDDMAKVIEQIAAAGGITVDEAITGLGILAKFANKTVEDWEKTGEAFLKNNGFINTSRDPREPVEMGEFGVILQRVIEDINKRIGG